MHYEKEFTLSRLFTAIYKYVYPCTGRLESKATVTVIRQDFAVGFSIGNKGYIGTGYTSSAFATDFWSYDPATDTWTQKADFGGNATVIVQPALVLAAKDISVRVAFPMVMTNDFWEYDTVTNMWTQIADIGGEPRASAVSMCIGDKGYVGTGFTTRGQQQAIFGNTTL